MKSKTVGSAKQISVLNQNATECGFHALKNALVGAALGLGSQKISQEDFKNELVYNEVFWWVLKNNESITEDASIAHLHQALLKLSEANPKELTPFLRALQP
nr:hypothetical protein [Nitrosopumilus sp.]